MDIVIVAHFTEEFEPSDNSRFKSLAEMLTRDGNEVEILTSAYDHMGKCPKQMRRKKLGYKVKCFREPAYKKNVCLKRFYSHFVWGRKVIRYLEHRRKPDVVFCAVPSLSGPNAVAKYCEKNGIRFVIDVQDLWPEAYRMVFNVPVISSVIFAPFRILADGIYKRADAICSVSDTYCERALSVNKKCSGYTTVFLGTELETFDGYAAEPPETEFDSEEIKLAYCGTLGSSYDLTCVIDALTLLKDCGKKIRFVVMGDGPRKKEFEEYAEKKGITATFTGWLPYYKMCSMLSRCDINVNPISHMAAQSIINKHSDYAASGLPILSTQENEEYRALVEKYNMGFNCNNNDPRDLADKLILLIEDDQLRKEMGRNARRCAEEKFDRKVSYIGLADAIYGR